MSQEILIRERTGQKLVPARFHEDVIADQLAQAESQWKPHRDAAADRLLAAGKTRREVCSLIQHVDWDWLKKARPCGRAR
jgi:hypothetical protein